MTNIWEARVSFKHGKDAWNNAPITLVGDTEEIAAARVNETVEMYWPKAKVIKVHSIKVISLKSDSAENNLLTLSANSAK